MELKRAAMICLFLMLSSFLLFTGSASAAPPSIAVLYPNGGEILTDRYANITWNASDPDNDQITLNIYYDTNRDKNDGRTMVFSGEINDGSFMWDLTGLICRDYYISIDAIAGLDITTDYSDGAFIKEGFNASYMSNNYLAQVSANNPPYVELTPSDIPLVRGVYPIRFNASDPDGDALFADIYYSEVQGSKNHTIAENLLLSDFCNDSCSYNWNTNGVNGDYYIDIVVTDGLLNTTNSSSIINFDNEVELNILYPNGGEHFTARHVDINWTASDIENWTILLNIYYDSDTDISNGRVQISANETNDGNYVWDLSSVEFGDYYVSIDAVSYGNNISITTTDYSDGNFTTVDNKPHLTVLHPNGGEHFTSRGVDINWTASDIENWTIFLNIYYDNDSNPSNGRTRISANETNDGSYVWDTSSIATGNYYISIDAVSYGLTYTGNNASFTATDYSDGNFTTVDNKPHLTVLHPNGGEVFSSKYININWTASDIENWTILLNIYYDIDNNPSNGRTILTMSHLSRIFICLFNQL
jgi:hypothetical protein